MPFVNEHYLKLTGAYLFPEIDRRVRAFQADRPDLADRIIRCGIGDVVGPIVPAVAATMHDAVDELADPARFRGYPPANGYDFLRHAIAEHDFRSRGAAIEDDEIFVATGRRATAATSSRSSAPTTSSPCRIRSTRSTWTPT